MISISFSISCFSQQIKKAEGEYTYIVPENVDLEKAKHIALERLKTQLIAESSAQLFPKTMLLPLRIATESQT